MTEQTNKITVLYLDDEAHNLSAFKASFRRKFNVLITESAEEAQALIEKHSPEIIIADHRMPLVTGVEFFERIKDEFPDPIRILLTAYTSSQTVIDAVNKGHIDRYMMKPWDQLMLESTLNSCLEIYNTRVELRIKIEELEKTNAELNRFVYSVSHDLRAPLMSILGLIHLVKIEEQPDEQAKFFDLMDKSVKKMDNYIQTTLEYYRNFKSSLNIEQIDVNAFVTEIIDSMGEYNEIVNFNVNIIGDLKISTDQMRLKIALGNLLSNAIKYGQNGESTYDIDISVSSVEDKLVISVQDYGIGIAKEELSRIFNMFYRSEGNTNTKSTGLGLYLVKDALSKIDGQVDVSSEIDKGTCFTLHIPNLKEA